ncbi:hypothetical protein HMI54_013003 [Coelomomyces lativittatus]|nr:hypothetical protein HMI54_013003 [Coelomomyces lativittatus]
MSRINNSLTSSSFCVLRSSANAYTQNSQMNGDEPGSNFSGNTSITMGSEEQLENRKNSVLGNAELQRALNEIQTLHAQLNIQVTVRDDQRHILQLTVKHTFNGITMFSSDSANGAITVEDFIQSVYVAISSVSLPHSLVVALLVRKLTGAAQTWFEKHQIENAKNSKLINTWAALKDELLNRFGSNIGIIQYERTLSSLVEGE